MNVAVKCVMKNGTKTEQYSFSVIRDFCKQPTHLPCVFSYSIQTPFKSPLEKDQQWRNEVGILLFFLLFS